MAVLRSSTFLPILICLRRKVASLQSMPTLNLFPDILYVDKKPQEVKITSPGPRFSIEAARPLSGPFRSLIPYGCRWKTLFMIFQSPSTFSSVNKSVNR